MRAVTQPQPQPTLRELEETIERGLTTFVEVGQALMEIRDRRLYRDRGFGRFEDYLGERWQMSRPRGYELISAAAVVANVSAAADIPPPANEAQARPLSRLPDDEQADAWREAVTTAPDGKVTADHVAAVVRRRLDPSFGGARPAHSRSGAIGYDSDEYFTPTKYLAAAREVMGGIDVDPASCAAAQKRVQARRFHTKQDSGLEHEWPGRVWLNPPYSQPLATQFATKLLEEFGAHRTIAAIMLMNASTDTVWFHRLATAGHLCLPLGRINFDRDDGATEGNRFGQVFFYLGARPEVFQAVFSDFGLVGRLHK